MAPSWAIPTGVLLGLVGIGLIFFAWFFPFAWKRGTEADKNDIDALPEGPEREARRAENRAIIERFARKSARARGEDVEDDIELQARPPPPYGHAASQEEADANRGPPPTGQV
jgi:hypothetical protein